MPGDAHAALARKANELLHSDLVIIGLASAEELLKRAWFYIPRMLQDDAKVLRCIGNQFQWQWISIQQDEIQALAREAARTKSAA
ncbi:MAG: hypothetical protein GTO41_07920 [Burkholderiales bacterium]|nr:hypothetical protein [Burkholderiales bacterium]